MATTDTARLTSGAASVGAGSLAANRLARGELARRHRAIEAIPDLEIGDRVTHDTWGLRHWWSTGAAAARTRQAEVDFGSAGRKWLVLRYARLGKL